MALTLKLERERVGNLNHLRKEPVMKDTNFYRPQSATTSTNSDNNNKENPNLPGFYRPEDEEEEEKENEASYPSF